MPVGAPRPRRPIAPRSRRRPRARPDGDYRCPSWRPNVARTASPLRHSGPRARRSIGPDPAVGAGRCVLAAVRRSAGRCRGDVRAAGRRGSGPGAEPSARRDGGSGPVPAIRCRDGHGAPRWGRRRVERRGPGRPGPGDRTPASGAGCRRRRAAAPDHPRGRGAAPRRRGAHRGRRRRPAADQHPDGVRAPRGRRPGAGPPRPGWWPCGALRAWACYRPPSRGPDRSAAVLRGRRSARVEGTGSKGSGTSDVRATAYRPARCAALASGPVASVRHRGGVMTVFLVHLLLGAPAPGRRGAGGAVDV